MDRNALAEETSPYLLQHKENPVHWQAWSPAVLAAAKAAGKLAIVGAMTLCYPLLTGLNLLCLAVFALRLRRWQVVAAAP